MTPKETPAEPRVDRTAIITGNAANIADAAIRVMVERGLDALSVRNVAEAARVAVGTVQYHMGTRDDIIAKAFIRSVQRQEHRAASQPESPDLLNVMTARLAELVPVGPEQREDAAVWVIMGAAASTRSWLARMYDAELTTFRSRVLAGLQAAAAMGILRPDVTPEQGARLVTALVNGLTLDYLNSPADPEQLRADLRTGLELLIRP